MSEDTLVRDTRSHHASSTAGQPRPTSLLITVVTLGAALLIATAAIILLVLDQGEDGVEPAEPGVSLLQEQ